MIPHPHLDSLRRYFEQLRPEDVAHMGRYYGEHAYFRDPFNEVRGLAAVQQFCRVGKGAMVGGLTGVNRDIIPYAMAFGDHAELAGLNLIGLKRGGLSREAINALRGAFRHIFHGRQGSIAARAREAREHWPAVSQVGEVVDFILADAKQELCLARRSGASR